MEVSCSLFAEEVKEPLKRLCTGFISIFRIEEQLTSLLCLLCVSLDFRFVFDLGFCPLIGIMLFSVTSESSFSLSSTFGTLFLSAEITLSYVLAT